MADSLDKVGSSAKISARQITSMAVAMSGMAMRLGASVLESRGMSTGARYLEGAGQMAMAGAAAMAPLGPQAAVVGAVGGAAIGAGKTYFDIQSEEAAREAKLAELETANETALQKFEALRAAAQESGDFYKLIGDESLDAARKQEMLAERMREFQARADELRASLDADELQRDGKAFAERMREYADALKEVDKAGAAADALAKDKPAEKAGSGMSLLGDADALQKMGIMVGGGGGIANTMMTVVQNIDKRLEESVAELREISKHRGAVWA